MQHSIPTKIKALKVNEKMVLFPKDYKVFMRGLHSHILRNHIPKINYKKAHVIIKDELFIGVQITRLEE